MIDGAFAGWGGLQNWRRDEVEVALVLRSTHWGRGRVILGRFLGTTFVDMQLDSVLALMPKTRKRLRALERLGFTYDGDDTFRDQPFSRYRLARAGYLPCAHAGG